MATNEELKVCGADVPVEKLVPLHERRVSANLSHAYRKIVASIREIGLIEPLCVYQENGHYVILDGFIRYKACRELGVKTLPCMVYPNKEAYTFNRMVNRLSPTQETRMLQKSLESIDEPTIARVFGMRRIQHRLSTFVTKRLHPEVVKALDSNLLSRCCAGEFTYVALERQQQMLEEMRRTKDYGISFARALVLKTPIGQRNRAVKRRSPWDKDPAQKKELVAKLEAIEKRYDFYTTLYRQYTTDLLKLCIYVRKLVSNDKVRAHLEQHTPAVLQQFERILFETQGKASDTETAAPVGGEQQAAPGTQ